MVKLRGIRRMWMERVTRPYLFPTAEDPGRKLLTDRAAYLLDGVRQIRNDCREYMTRDTAEISPERQVSWWLSQPRNVRLHALWMEEDKTDGKGPQRDVIGYGLMRFETGAWWLSGGLAPAWRGQGLGRTLFTDMMRNARADDWFALEVREDNEAAVRLYGALGFKVARAAVAEFGVVLIMERKGTRE